VKDDEFEPATQAERLAETIADSVLSGDFPPGFPLDETALTERFGASRTPVREAIRLLGLIDVKPRRGASGSQTAPRLGLPFTGPSLHVRRGLIA
jgi:DNA-binding GntR family transcriptional regulator